MLIMNSSIEQILGEKDVVVCRFNSKAFNLIDDLLFGRTKQVLIKSNSLILISATTFSRNFIMYIKIKKAPLGRCFFIKV